MRFSHHIIKSEDGVAAIEFGIWLAFIIPLFLTSVDFALYGLNRINVYNAVGEAAVFSFKNRDTVDSDIETTLENIILQSSGIDAEKTVVTVTCNGSTNCTDTNRPLQCLNVASEDGEVQGQESIFFTNASGNCSNDTPPGYFLTIDVSFTPSPIFNGPATPPRAITSTLTVKLE